MVKCDVCQVSIPEGEEAKELHETGKRHIRARAQQETVLSLAERSIFMKITGGTLDRKVVSDVASQFGAVDRLIFRDSSSFAIVEYKDASFVTAALEKGTIEHAAVVVTISKRRLNFSSEPAEEKLSINVAEVCSLSKASQGFSSQIDTVIEQIAISENDMNFRESFMKRLETELSRYFINPRVTIFGSSVTSIGTKDSDIDACLDLDPPTEVSFMGERDKFTLLTCDPCVIRGRRVSSAELLRLSAPDRARFLCKILNEIRKEAGWIGHQRPVLDARCPVVRFIADKHVLIDLSIDNRLGCAKSNYLKVQLQQDKTGKLRQILLGFRFWAMSNGLFEPLPNQHKGHFNAYMLNLLVISFMRHMGLISLFRYTDNKVMAGRWRIDFEYPQLSLETWELSTFFKEFFVYVISTNFADSVIVHDQPPLSKTDFSAANEVLLKDFKFAPLNIQDPLEHTHNVCQNICEKSVALMRKQMMFSLARMKKSKLIEVSTSNTEVDSFSDLCCLSADSDSRPASSNDDVISDSLLQATPTRSVSRLRNVTEKISPSDAKPVVSSILEEILAFEAETAPAFKRMRVDEEEQDEYICQLGVFTINHRLWVGRRNLRRKLAAAASPNSPELLLEREVSRALLSSTNASDTQKSFGRVRVSIALGRDQSLCILFDRIEGDPAEMTNLAHFIEQLLEKNRIPVIQQILGENVDCVQDDVEMTA